MSNCSSSTSRSSRRWGGGCWRVAPLSEKSHAGTSEGVSLRTRVLRTERQEGRERVSELPTIIPHHVQAPGGK